MSVPGILPDQEQRPIYTKPAPFRTESIGQLRNIRRELCPPFLPKPVRELVFRFAQRRRIPHSRGHEGWDPEPTGGPMRREQKQDPIGIGNETTI